MQKIVSLNMEMHKHYNRVFPFLEKESADIVCLMEAPEEITPRLEKLGYQTSFAPMFVSKRDEVTRTIGLILGTRTKHTSKATYYVPEHVRNGNDSTSFPYLMGNIATSDGIYRVGVLHGPVTPAGKEDAFQVTSYGTLLNLLKKEQPHILCGDFNMPRAYNNNYEHFLEVYKDEIPAKYTSSLDRALHTLGTRADLDMPIFDIFMVDYIFSQTPYYTENVRLEFGVSDHAAIVADLYINVT